MIRPIPLLSRSTPAHLLTALSQDISVLIALSSADKHLDSDITYLLTDGVIELGEIESEDAPEYLVALDVALRRIVEFDVVHDNQVFFAKSGMPLAMVQLHVWERLAAN